MAGINYGRLKHDLQDRGFDYSTKSEVIMKFGKEDANGYPVVLFWIENVTGISDTDAAQDAAGNTLGAGSIAIDSKKGKMYVADTSNLWQIVTS